jgi:hypothetical protein
MIRPVIRVVEMDVHSLHFSSEVVTTPTRATLSLRSDSSILRILAACDFKPTKVGEEYQALVGKQFENDLECLPQLPKKV